MGGVVIPFTGLKLFGSSFECACGKTHRVEPNEIIYAKDAGSRLPQVLSEYVAGRRAAVLMDARTREAAGAEVARNLSWAGWRIAEIVVPDPGPGESPVCDDVTKQALERQIGEQDAIVPVGAGTIGDLGKWIAGDRGIPFVCFATAASMNGYASANVAPAIQGVKTLVRARPPKAVVSAPDVLRDAPYEMTASGLGDILAKSVSSADWRMNQFLFGDYYCERSVGLIADVEPLVFERPEGIARRKPEAIEALFHALLLTGAAMTMAETSAPASGGEHAISHALDMMSFLDGVPHDLHGRQVGVGTVLMAELYRRVLALESPVFVQPPATVDSAFWGPLAKVVAGHYAEKQERLRIAREKLAQGNTWDAMRETLTPLLRPPETVHSCLARAGAACRAEHLGCDRARLRTAVIHAHEIRSRFTILDLGWLTGLLPATANPMLEMWA